MKWYQNETSKMNCQFIVFFMQHDNIQFSIWLALFFCFFFVFIKDGTLVWRYGLYVVILSGLQITIELCICVFLICIYRFSFTNRNNVTVRVIKYGATITDIGYSQTFPSLHLSTSDITSYTWCTLYSTQTTFLLNYINQFRIMSLYCCLSRVITIHK